MFSPNRQVPNGLIQGTLQLYPYGNNGSQRAKACKQSKKPTVANVKQ